MPRALARRPQPNRDADCTLRASSKGELVEGRISRQVDFAGFDSGGRCKCFALRALYIERSLSPEVERECGVSKADLKSYREFSNVLEPHRRKVADVAGLDRRFALVD